ncbi:Prokaryotic cytochrome b561 [Seminavis robusta]|uniref:Prokaryotic cytochrome b561 n=1 Tax=Seminavis robusta TaxID=568900 RepID=A0A9N8HBF3_9STRA|nr:Prokaryotic cytochrome b561 [Seminavis robusta]|eukprot:Sro274_g105550.1 Prokaryotic cytochrome b561 (191) ;mRNA; f:66911-67893
MNAPKAAYSVGASWLHWATAIPLIGCVGTVLKAQDAPKSEKGTWMHRHKSLGLLTGMIVLPRVAYRLGNMAAYKVKGIPGVSDVEHKAASLTHYALYGFMTVMPATGIAMGYFGGKGLPFFGTTFGGIVSTDDTKARNGSIAKNSFKIHKQLGTYGKFVVPLHVAGAFQHFFRGHTIFARVNPFRGPPKH